MKLLGTIVECVSAIVIVIASLLFTLLSLVLVVLGCSSIIWIPALIIYLLVN